MIKKKDFYGEPDIGGVYERRDEQKAVVYHYDCITRRYCCVILGTTTFFDVDEQGNYLANAESHNDLMRKLY